MNSETALQLLNIAVVHMKFAKILPAERPSATLNLSSQCSNSNWAEAWHIKTATATEKLVDEAAEGVRHHSARISDRSNISEQMLLFYVYVFLVLSSGTKYENNAAKFGVNDSTAPLSLTLRSVRSSEASPSTVCCNQHQHWCLGNHSKLNFQEEREKMQMRICSWLCGTLFSSIAEPLHEPGSNEKIEKWTDDAVSLAVWWNSLIFTRPFPWLNGLDFNILLLCTFHTNKFNSPAGKRQFCRFFLCPHPF